MKTSFPLLPLTKGATSSKFPVVLSFSTLTAPAVALFLNNLLVFFHRLSTSSVSFSEAFTIVSLMFMWIGASMVHMNLVPMLIPSAPRLSAAASPWPSANPPEAMNGTLRDCRARLRRIKLVMSVSPTWPAH